MKCHFSPGWKFLIFFSATLKLGLDYCHILKPTTLSLFPAHSCFRSDQLLRSRASHSPSVFPLLPQPHTPTYFRKPTPILLHSYTRDAQTITICHASPHQPHSEYLKDPQWPSQILTEWVLYPSPTLHTSISPMSNQHQEAYVFLCSCLLFIMFYVTSHLFDVYYCLGELLCCNTSSSYVFFISRIGYEELLGGAVAFRAEHFRLVNGYSNQYYGWGGEDDDMHRRWWQFHNNLYFFITSVSSNPSGKWQHKSPAGKSVDSLLSWHGSHFWVCITFCNVWQCHQTRIILLLL